MGWKTEVSDGLDDIKRLNDAHGLNSPMDCPQKVGGHLSVGRHQRDG